MDNETASLIKLIWITQSHCNYLSMLGLRETALIINATLNDYMRTISEEGLLFLSELAGG